MKKLAARNYEDLLQVRNCFLSSKLITHSLYQCSIPVFEGLLPKKEDKVILKLLFELGTWHALAKLRIHTETTVTDLENSATRLSDLLRKFKSDVCSIYATKELPAEEAARGRLKAAKVLKSGGEAERPAVKVEDSGKKKKNEILRVYNGDLQATWTTRLPGSYSRIWSHREHEHQECTSVIIYLKIKNKK
jgi:hypothetical protein